MSEAYCCDACDIVVGSITAAPWFRVERLAARVISEPRHWHFCSTKCLASLPALLEELHKGQQFVEFELLEREARA